MPKSQLSKVIVGLVALLIVAVAAFFLYDAVLGETEPASGPITAPTLALPTSEPSATALATEPPAAAPTATAAEVIAPTDTPQVAVPASSLQIFRLSQAESQASFTIYELLRGSPKDVVGITNQVAGEVAVDPDDLSRTQIGEIRINARTLVTDDDRRNSAIRNRILFTDRYEYIIFQPIEIIGLSGQGTPGQTYTFQVSGDLTIKDVTQRVTFDVTLTVESAERLSGVATATILRSAFKLIVPDVPFVADVADEVRLKLQFVLTP